MKITKTEKIWLVIVIILYACYNLPFFPAYGHAKATLIHAAVTLIPLWIAIYIGLFKVCKIYRIKTPQPSQSEDHFIDTDAADTSNAHLSDAENATNNKEAL